MGLLDSIANSNPICREHYGCDYDNKPNSHCNWTSRDHMVGWYETDKHLRERMVKRMNNE